MNTPQDVGGLPELPVPVGHVHSDYEYCAERPFKNDGWPVSVYEAGQMRAIYQKGREDERATLRAAGSGEGEALESIAQRLNCLMVADGYRDERSRLVSDIRKLAHGGGAGDAELRKAAERVNKLYPLHWDRVDGCAVIMPERITEFEEAFAALDAAIAAQRKEGDDHG